MDSIFNNQNVGPFICRELIQRLVTSNPSRDYVYRVAQVFNNDGTGVRGNLQAVVQAILLDYEARSPDMISQPTYGKQREPLLRVTALARAFPAPPTVSGTYSQTTNQIITITTPAPHLLNNGDTAYLIFTDTSGNAAPTSQGYSVTATSPTTLHRSTRRNFWPALTARPMASSPLAFPATAWSGNDPVYLVFTTGGASSGLFVVSNVIDSTHFTVGNRGFGRRAPAVACCRNSPSAATRKPARISSSAPPARMAWFPATVSISISLPAPPPAEPISVASVSRPDVISP